jgi:hypothetical protein
MYLIKGSTHVLKLLESHFFLQKLNFKNYATDLNYFIKADIQIVCDHMKR